MRALRLCGLTLAVAAGHGIAWRIVSAAADAAPPRPARAGVRWIAPGAPAPPAAASTSRPSPRVAAAAPRAPAIERGPPAARRAASPARPRTGEGGRARRRDAATPPPIYPTRLPPPAQIRYRLVQDGAPRGGATLDWTLDATRFSLRLLLDADGAPRREWVSAGGFDAAGVAPARLAERARGRDKRAVDFDRAAGRVRFSGAEPDQALAPGMQDRWSWLAQLAAIAEAADLPARRVRAGTAWTIDIAGLRGETARWVFRVLPDAGLPPDAGSQGDASSIDDGRARALLHLLREPDRPYDLRIEAWLSPARHHLPVALRLSTPPSGWIMALWPADAVRAPPAPGPLESPATGPTSEAKQKDPT